MTALPLCQINEIADGSSMGRTAEVSGKRTRLIIVRKGGCFFVYVNSCPHNRGPLDFIPDQFLTPAKDMILCAGHGAQFRIEDGYCVIGPCAGKALQPIPCTVRDGSVWLD